MGDSWGRRENTWNISMQVKTLTRSEFKTGRFQFSSTSLKVFLSQSVLKTQTGEMLIISGILKNCRIRRRIECSL